MSRKAKSEDTRIAEKRMRRDPRVVLILDEITKKFVFSGCPMSVKSRNNTAYGWTPKKKTFESPLDFCSFIMEFIKHEMPDMHPIFNPYNIGDVGLAIRGMVEEEGSTTNGYKPSVDMDKNGIPEDINTIRSKESYSVEELTEDILAKYEINTALDQNFLIFTNRKTKEHESPIGGIGPIFRIASIIDGELGFAQPETELITGVASRILDLAKKKKPATRNTYSQFNYVGVSGKMDHANGLGLYVLGGRNS